MNCYKVISKNILIPSAIALVSVALSPLASKAATFWDIQLFDETGTQVGEGDFSYDLETEDTITLDNVQTPQNLPENSVTVNTKLDTFSLNLLGESLLTEPEREPWFELNSENALNSFGRLRDFGQIFEEKWSTNLFFIEPSPGRDFISFNDVLSMSGSSTSDSAEGEWRFNSNNVRLEPLNTIPFNSAEPIRNELAEGLRDLAISGTWNATLRADSGGDTLDPSDPPLTTTETTPESSSIMALLGLAGLGLMLKNKNQSCIKLTKS